MMRDSPHPELVSTAAFAKLRNLRALPVVKKHTATAAVTAARDATSTIKPALIPRLIQPTAAIGPSATAAIGPSATGSLLDKLKITLSTVEKSYLISIIAVALVVLFCVASMKMKQHKRFKENNTNFKWFV